MLKKYLLFFLFLFCSFNAQASIWDIISGCITDPCNCGQSERTEIWNEGSANEVKKTFKTGANCPPWNKSDGRDPDNCLRQFDYPGRFTPFVLNRCAEETPESSYFTPKIRIRIQSCNAAACWSQSSTLNWDGECVLWPTGYGLPLTRVCARIAVPAMSPPPGINANPSPADPGYTSGVHLNTVGFTEKDDVIVGVDGQILNLERPKLCAYSDPGLVNLVSDSGAHTDAMDWNPNKQVLHQTNELSPVAQVLKFLVETVGGANLPNLLAKLLGMIDQDSEIIKVLQAIFNAIGEIFNIFPDLLINAIKTFGSLNKSVDDYSFGCVNLPLGPFPPPFCKSLNDLSVPAVINTICSVKNPGGKTFDQSSRIPPCVVSNVRNNVINNTVRVSFNNLIPLCTGTNPDLTTCVQLDNIGPFSSASGAHTATAYKDFVKSCDKSPSNAPCIKTAIPLSCSVNANGCDQGFRIVYSKVMGSIETPGDYFTSDIPDCNTTGANNSTTCQKIWGVNIGEFIDVSVQFPKVQGQDAKSLLPVQQNFTLKDNNGKVRNLYASVSNTKTPRQDPENICVFEDNALAGCTPRVNDSYSLTTYECERQYSGITCPKNTYYTPQFVASMQVRDDSGNIIDQTSTLITPLSYADSDPSSTATESIVTLAGYNYSSSVAFIPKDPPKHPDDKYIGMPFSGPNSLNQITIYGLYKDNEQPYDSNGNPNSKAVYLKYLEYINGKYIQGGTHACLMPKNFQHCSPVPITPGSSNSSNEQINCVLAKLDQSNTVDCSEFKNTLLTYPNLSLCKSTSGCSQGVTIPSPRTGSGKGVTIYNCSNNTNCYVNNDNSDTPVCVLTRDYLNRIDPSPNLGSILAADQYYKVSFDKDTKLPTYDVKVSDVRDKTWRELNLCSPISVPVCSAITSQQAIHGNALWDEIDIGELATGRCPLNWVVIDPSKPLQRYCLSNFDSRTVEFEPLGQNVGCRESKGLPIDVIDNNFPKSTIRPQNPYDPVTKTGDFFLNVKPKTSSWNSSDMAFDPNDGAKIDAIDEPDQTKLFTITFKVTLDAIIADIDYFKILDLWYDDCVLIKVNGTKVLSEPNDVDYLDYKYQCNGGRDQGKALQAVNPDSPLDIKKYLQQGENTIQFQLRVIGGGGLYYHMQYKMLR
ncbi:MAG: hypothetical protein RCO49_05800 [Rickettsia endosymbiont of Argas persicus]